MKATERCPFLTATSSRYFGIDRYVRPMDSSSRFCNLSLKNHSLQYRKEVPNGRRKWTEGDHARDRACRVEHAERERFYRPGKGYGRRAAKALRRSAWL